MSSKIARADCTEAVGRTNYTASLNDDGHLQNEYNSNREDAGLERSDNDLSAYMFKQYLKGNIDDTHVKAFEKTIVGYRDPSVNEGDEERQVVCKEKFEEKFGEEYPAVEN